MKVWHVLYSPETNNFRLVFGRKSTFIDGAFGEGTSYNYIGRF